MNYEFEANPLPFELDTYIPFELTTSNINNSIFDIRNLMITSEPPFETLNNAVNRTDFSDNYEITYIETESNHIQNNELLRLEHKPSLTRSNTI